MLPTRLAVVALTAAALLAPPAAHAEANPSLEITQSLFDQDGWPELLANGLSVYEDPVQATFQWRICAPDCGDVVSEDAMLSPGPTAAGTRFQVTSTLGSKSSTVMSRPWLGRVTNVTPPTITGTPAIGATIAAHPGTWSGGWGTDASFYGLRACRTLAAIDCRAMEPAATGAEDEARPLKIPTAYGGWYVGAVETRYAAETAWAGTGLSFPGNIVSPNTMRRLETTDAAGPLIGPIPAATPEQLAAAKPKVVLRSRALRRGKRLILGTVTCPEGCQGGTFVTQDDPDDGDGGEMEVQPTKPLTLWIGIRRFEPHRTVKAQVTVEGLGRFVKRIRLP